MANFLKNVLGGDKKPATRPVASDADFADFAAAPEPQPESLAATLATSLTGGTTPTSRPIALPYTKWYRVWERTSPADFFQEMIIIPFMIVVLLVHWLGRKGNRNKAAEWAKHFSPPMDFEFASVGFEKQQKTEPRKDPASILKEMKADEFISYATGRNNVAFLDIKIILMKRYNPFVIFAEHVAGFIFEGLPPTQERMEATAYAFDGKEDMLVPPKKGEAPVKAANSSFDGFVFAIVHKNMIKRIREDRYDLSLTSTKDNPKLPAWTTVLSENGEITDAILTSDLVKAIEDAGDLFQTLIITDQPLERPTKLSETVPRKRISLSLRLPSRHVDYPKLLPLWAIFLRLPDFLVSNAKFRPEVMRKVKQVRDNQINRIKKEKEDEEAEERKTQQDKDKKEKREALLKSMSASEQKKFLEKEREKDMRRSQKRRTMRA